MPTLTSRTKSWKRSLQPAAKLEPILGIDPGLSAAGFGVIVDSTVLGFGVIQTDAAQSVSERLLFLSAELERVIKKFRPGSCAIESLFFKGGGARSVILSAQSRGVILLALARRRIPVFELTPATVKLALTGSGRASKQQLNYMVRRLLKIDTRIPEHAADALAVAFCLQRRMSR